MNSESGHWYELDGTPAYTQTMKDGRIRNTTLADARKKNLVPSVTTILNVAAKHGLNTWLQQQVLLAALTLPRLDGEPEAAWLERVMSDSKSTGREAADRGTRMHGVLERFFKSETLEVWPIYCIEVKRALDAHFGEQPWQCEKSFAHEDGFGGKVDMFVPPVGDSPGIVVDFKTKEGSLDKVTPFHEQIMQLAAYDSGLGMDGARCANVYLNEVGEVKIFEYTNLELGEAYDCFFHLLRFYRIKNKI